MLRIQNRFKIGDKVRYYDSRCDIQEGIIAGYTYTESLLSKPQMKYYICNVNHYEMIEKGIPKVLIKVPDKDIWIP